MASSSLVLSLLNLVPEAISDRHGLSLKWNRQGYNCRLRALDQRELPKLEVWDDLDSNSKCIEKIQCLAIRGAPLIGISACFSLAKWACDYFIRNEGDSKTKFSFEYSAELARKWFIENSETFKNTGNRKTEMSIFRDHGFEDFVRDFNVQLSRLEDSRPTAVNLRNNLRLLRNGFEILADRCFGETARSEFDNFFGVEVSGTDFEFGQFQQSIVAAGMAILSESLFDQDVETCSELATKGAEYIGNGFQLLTICNTGGLATAGGGTALNAIKLAHRQGKKIHVWICETRPLFQGSRLTAWELANAGVPHTLITDSMAGYLMRTHKIHAVFAGADRIALNGDVANKIGTYNLAVLAKFHSVPFYIVAPRTTFDPYCSRGDDIPIEVRDANEVRMDRAPAETHVWNPAFDVVPSDLITLTISNDFSL